MLLIITYSASARSSLRNIHRSHEGSVVRWFGRSALFEATELGAFLALRLREKHPDAVQIERTRPFNEFEEVPAHVRKAARVYETRDHVSTPYSAFAAGTDHPDPETMAERDL
jgi:hypothetical protein